MDDRKSARDELPAGDGTKLPYGLRADGTLAHVAEVPAGLACGCVCPGCSLPLVARKGAVRVHHFAHHVDRNCAAAWESTLHLLAKEVIAGGSAITLPETVAEAAGQRRVIAPSKAFAYDRVDLEVSMGAIRPDAVVHGSGRELLVEVAVTHFADAAKYAFLRERAISCMEINLSKLERHGTREQHADAILHAAPRIWLHNRRVAETEAEFAKKAEEALARAQAVREAAAREHAAKAKEAWEAPDERTRWGAERATALARDAELSGAFGLEVPGSRVFVATNIEWQATLLTFSMTTLGDWDIEVGAACDHLKRREAIRPFFARWEKWSQIEIAAVRATISDFRTPDEVVEAWCQRLEAAGLTQAVVPGRWRFRPGLAREAIARADATRHGRQRVAELRRVLSEAVDASEEGVFDQDEWMDAPVSPTDARTRKDASREDAAWHAATLETLRALKRMATLEDAEPVQDLMGLPLRAAFEARTAEKRARDAAAAEREGARRSVRDRVEAEWRAHIRRRAADAFDAGQGEEWAARTLQDYPDDEPDWMTRARRKRAEDALWNDAEPVRSERARQARIRAEEEAAQVAIAKLRDRLQHRAYAVYGGDLERIALFMRSGRYELGRVSPADYVTDEGSLKKCLQILDGIAKPKGKR